MFPTTQMNGMGQTNMSPAEDHESGEPLNESRQAGRRRQEMQTVFMSESKADWHQGPRRVLHPR